MLCCNSSCYRVNISYAVMTAVVMWTTWQTNIVLCLFRELQSASVRVWHTRAAPAAHISVWSLKVKNVPIFEVFPASPDMCGMTFPTLCLTLKKCINLEVCRDIPVCSPVSSSQWTQSDACSLKTLAGVGFKVTGNVTFQESGLHKYVYYLLTYLSG